MKICSIIVCFNPEINNVIKLSNVLLNSGSKVVIIDNTFESYINKNKELSECQLIMLNENKGISFAQNIGIRRALKEGSEVIVFFDQDSKIDKQFLPLLIAPLKVGEPKVVAPVYFDLTKGFEFPSMRLNKFGFLVKVYKKNSLTPYDVDVVISSGMATTKETFEIVGLMDENFFIDFVDTEWCLRCRSHKISIQVVPDAIMMHSIGEYSINLGILRCFVHSPTRCYYQIRNSFYFIKIKHIPVLLAIKEIISLFIHHIILLIVLRNKIPYIKAYFSAVLHGMRGVVSKKPE